MTGSSILEPGKFSSTEQSRQGMYGRLGGCTEGSAELSKI